VTGALPGPPIVVGVDGTPGSAAAVRWAVREARLRHGTVHLVFAVDQRRGRFAPYAPGTGAPDIAEAYADARELLAAAAELAGASLPPERLRSELADGLPARVLVDRASAAGLLVLGITTRAAGQPEGDRGPVVRACLRHSPCPVVVVAPSPGTR
jgi:nucleotide-binding universal stress UspA family protein